MYRFNNFSREFKKSTETVIIMRDKERHKILVSQKVYKNIKSLAEYNKISYSKTIELLYLYYITTKD